ncbi:MAG: S4 domain-containing protein, partial [Methylocella sp.]
TEATAMVHGREAASRAARAARTTFEEGGLAVSLPSVEIPATEIEAGLGVLAAFVKAGLVASTGEARRQIKGGGLKVNDQTVTEERAVIGPRDLTGGAVKLSLGRKRHVLLKVA